MSADNSHGISFREFAISVCFNIGKSTTRYMEKVYLFILSILFSFVVDEVVASTMYSSSTGNWVQDATWTDITINDTVYRVPETGGPSTVVIQAGHTVTISSVVNYSGTIIIKSGGALIFDREGSNSGQLIMDEDSIVILEEGSDISSTGNANGADGDTKNYLQIGTGTLYGGDINNLESPLTIDENFIITLPVELLFFTATPQKTAVKLDWASSKAWDFSHYELERSADGITFEYLATIDAEENTDWIVNYTYSDRQPLSGLSYYRLKAVDIDGTFEYKGIEVVQFAGTASLKVYPNPSNRGILNVQQQESAGARVSLKDNSGRTVYAGTMEASFKTIDTSSLQPGLYVLTLESTTGVQKKHVIIQ